MSDDETTVTLGPHDAALIVRNGGKGEPEFEMPDYGDREIVPEDILVLAAAFNAIADKDQAYYLLRGMVRDEIRGGDFYE